MSRALAAASLVALFFAALVPLRASALPVERAQRCATPAGRWRARADRPTDGIDELITVTLEGTGPRFRGLATTDYWFGPAGTAPPIACGPGVVHRILHAPMAAELAGDQLSWWVSDPSAVTEEVLCGGPSTAGHSSGRTVGTVDLARGIFEGYFDVRVQPGPVRYLHVVCAPR